MGLIVACKPPVPDMPHYTHHPQGIGAHADPKLLAEGLLSAESLPPHHVVNHHDGLAAHAIPIVEESALQHPDAHHFQIVRRHAGGQRDRLLALRRLSRRHPVADLVIAFAQRDGIGHGYGLDARYVAGAIQNIVPGRTDLRWIGERAGRKRHAGDQYVTDIHARVKRREMQECAPEHPGGNQ